MTYRFSCQNYCIKRRLQ